MDTAHPDELLLGLDALNTETLEQCIAVDVDCVLPQLTDLLAQYDTAGELVRHAIDFGYVWAEQGQGEPHWLEKWQSVMELEDCHRLDLALDLAQNLHCYEFIPPWCGPGPIWHGAGKKGEYTQSESLAEPVL